ncbi:MAG: sensor histidine kinase [Solirubrobacteraceae bacterium]
MLATTIARWIPVAVTALWVVTWSPPALALDPSLDISKYGHTAWRNLGESGSGTIGAIAQTSDGYLWLGTPSGLLRFDGVRSVAWRAPAGSALPDERVRALLGARDGALWVGTLRGLASWKDGRLVTYPSLKGKTVNDLKEDADGTIWVGGSSADKAFLCQIRKEEGDACRGADGDFGSAIVALSLDASGALWACGIDRVWRVKPAPVLSYPLPWAVGALQTMVGTHDGGIAVGTRGTIVKIANGQVQTLPLAPSAEGLPFTKALSDRDGGLWIATTDSGLLHLHEGRVDAFTASEGLSGDQVLGLFEDHEANVWVSTSHGLDRFRPMAAAIYSREDGIKGRAASIIAARDGSLWASTTTAVYRLDHGQVSEVRPSPSATLFEDRRGRIWSASQSGIGYMEGGHFVAASGISTARIDGIAEDSKGNIWFATRDAGLLRLRPDGNVERTTWADLGIRGRVSTMIADPADDGLWLGLWSGAVVNVYEGKVRASFELRDARGDSGVVRQLRFDPGGALWAASRAELIRIDRGRVSRLDSRNGMPCDGAFWSMLDDHSVWVYTACGLVEIARRELDAWASAPGDDANRKIKVRVLDRWQGIGQPANVSGVGQVESVQLFTPKAARAPDGRIWFVTGEGFVAVDPARIPVNSVAPPVHVEQIVSDGTLHEPRAGLQLPPLQRDVKIGYTGLSFTVPEQVQFRYRLDGRDTEWQDAGTRREAFYTDLAPGHYRFRVIAANNSGVWNDRGDTLQFSIAPAWWQSDAFRVACAAAIVLALYALYRLRMGRLSRQFNLSLDARVNERLRIARDLHDTLLQSVQGQLLRLQTALQLWPSGESRRILEESIDQAADAITEGRDAVQGLRASIAETQGLGDAIRSFGETLAIDPARPAIAFSVEVLGQPRPLHPVVRDDIFRIAGEAVRNAFRHAQPTRVEVEIRYDERELRVRVRDNGKGMAVSIVRRGREAHFGLPGMRERAKLIGSKLTLWSRLDAGTEVELRTPAARAYAVATDALESNSIEDLAEQPTVEAG